MLGGPVGSRRAKRRAVPLPGQARWFLLRRHQDVPARRAVKPPDISLAALRERGPRRRPTISRWGVAARQLPGVRHGDRHHARIARRQMRLPADHPSGRPVRRVSSRARRHTFVSTSPRAASQPRTSGGRPPADQNDRVGLPP